MKENILIIGGGAAGYFAAINIAENHPNSKVTILEGSSNVLQKVKVSGGGRCNVTHACFDPKELTAFYPRGGKELLGPFHQFMTGDTMEWFEKRGVALKIEEDNRVFPQENTSQAIINCFQNEAKKHKVTVFTNCRVSSFYTKENQWIVNTKDTVFTADKLVVASGSNAKIWQQLQNLGHTIVKPVPSLFTFNIKDDLISDLAGISVPNATLKIADSNLESNGALLITHWGLSGPSVLKLSAFGARILAEKKYHYKVIVNWISKTDTNTFDALTLFKKSNGNKKVTAKSPFDEIPKRLWERFLIATDIESHKNWGELSNKELQNVSRQLTQTIFTANGKSTFKEEFVTAGGVDLKEVNFKKMESKLHKNLFFAGEVLDVDAVTGGFNFQNAWTTARLVSRSLFL